MWTFRVRSSKYGRTETHSNHVVRLPEFVILLQLGPLIGGRGSPCPMLNLRLERGGGQQIVLSCACFLITQPFLNIPRHAIYQMKAEYHSYLLVTLILYNSSDVKLKIVNEI